MKKILFLDFEDSFTHNVVQELRRPGFELQVISWHEFSATFTADLLVLGPGPGHPEDYDALLPELHSWIERGGKVFGVCLGHQLLWRSFGAEVHRSSRPSHGQRVELMLDAQWQAWLDIPSGTKVQRYNSLSVHRPTVLENDVYVHCQEGEILMSRGENFLTYQFHPESVGTKCREAFFRPVFSHLL